MNAQTAWNLAHGVPLTRHGYPGVTIPPEGTPAPANPSRGLRIEPLDD